MSAAPAAAYQRTTKRGPTFRRRNQPSAADAERTELHDHSRRALATALRFVGFDARAHLDGFHGGAAVIFLRLDRDRAVRQGELLEAVLRHAEWKPDHELDVAQHAFYHVVHLHHRRSQATLALIIAMGPPAGANPAREPA